MGSPLVALAFSESNSAAGTVLARRLRFALLAAPLIGATFLSKFAFPPFGALGIGISVFLLLGTVVLGSIGGGISFEPRRLTLYVTMIGVLGLMQIFQPDAFSVSSLLLLVAVHLPYAFTVRNGDDGDRIIKFFLGIVVFFACCGIAQYCLQFLVNPRFLFPIENFVPESLIVQHFNHQAAMEYGSKEFRANGVFLLEPSFFSQLLAVAIVAELCTLGRKTRLALFGIALIVSYSGTGFLVLAICLPLVLVARRRWGLLLACLFASAVMIALHAYFHTGRLLSRVAEFGSTQSSAYSRFIGGFNLFEQFLWHDPWRTLFGYGAGAYTNYATHLHYSADAMALFKIVFEFGLVGGVTYFGFLFCCLFYSTAPRFLTLAVGITYLLNGIYTPFAHGLALSLLLWTSGHRTEGRFEWLAGFDRKHPRKASFRAALPAPRVGG